MARLRPVPHAGRDRVPGLRRTSDRSRRKRHGLPVSGACSGVAPGGKRPAAALTGGSLQQAARLVALSPGPYLCHYRGSADRERLRLSLLCRKEGSGRLQRSGNHSTADCSTMAPHLERFADAPDGDGWLPQKSLVGLPGGAYLESRHLFPGGAAKARVPRLRRESPAGTAGTLPADAGGG